MKIFAGTLGSIILLVLLSDLILGCSVLSRCDNALEIKAQADMRVIGYYIETYKNDHGEFPKSLSNLVDRYLSTIPKDPWGVEYRYHLELGEILLYTFDQGEENKIIYERIEKDI